MRIVYSVSTTLGGGGLGVDAIAALRLMYDKGYLKKAVVYKNKQDQIPRNLVRTIRINPTKVFSNLPSRYYYPIKRKYLDIITRRELGKGADLFHGWSSSSLFSLRFCRKNGIISILENPGPHCVYAESILNEEYDDLGIKRVSQPEYFKKFFGQDEEYHLSEYEEASYILLESKFTRDTFLEQGFPEEKLLVVPRGVNTERFVPAPEGAGGHGPFRVLFVGALCVRKGIRYLLEAWSELNLKNAELVAAGTVRDEIKHIVTEYTGKCPNIRVLGHVADPVSLYQSASVFAFPSLSEGSAKVVYEAMATGLPVIVTPNTGSVARDGVDGFLVPPRDKEALKEKLLQLYENPELRVAMGERARRHMESYTWDRHRQQLLDIYERAYRKEKPEDSRIQPDDHH